MEYILEYTLLLRNYILMTGFLTIVYYKNAFQLKAHLPLDDRKSNTYNMTFEWPWPWYILDLRQVKPS